MPDGLLQGLHQAMYALFFLQQPAQMLVKGRVFVKAGLIQQRLDRFELQAQFPVKAPLLSPLKRLHIKQRR